MRSGILVLGMHRGGTSALTGSLPHLGVQLGADLMAADPQNAKGFFESKRVCVLMERFLEDCGSFWHDWRPLEAEGAPPLARRKLITSLTSLLRDEFKHLPAFAIKDPRNCRAVSLWLEVFRELGVEPVIAIIVRHPVCVAASLEKRDGMPFDKALLLWLRHMLDAERETRSCLRTFITYDQLLTDWQSQLSKIGNLLGVDGSAISDQQRSAVSVHLDQSLRHHVPDEESVTLMSAVGPWFERTWQILSGYASSTGAYEVPVVLSQINQDFDNWCRPFSHYFGKVEGELARLKTTVAERRPILAAMSQSVISDRTNRELQVLRPCSNPQPVDAVCAEAVMDAVGLKCFVLVRSWKRDTATVRLQSDPILRGLLTRSSAPVAVHLPEPGSILTLTQPSCLIFHYDDKAAVHAIRSMSRNGMSSMIVCLGADVYSYSEYADVHEFVDFYVVPTKLHQEVLQGRLYKPVYVLPECTDPIALTGNGEAQRFPLKVHKRAVWFGYSDSFYKSMSSFTPIIQKAAAERLIDEFAIIVDERQFRLKYSNPFGFPILPYDGDTFGCDVKNYDYAILSHFSLDLAMNTYIKSPNKAITAVTAGLIPIASDTPSYRELFRKYGMERFLFSSAPDLERILTRLDPVADSRFMRDSGIVASMAKEFSHERYYEGFLGIMRDYIDRVRNKLPQVSLMTYDDVTRARLGGHPSQLEMSVTSGFAPKS